jgi:hypothetical protein
MDLASTMASLSQAAAFLSDDETPASRNSSPIAGGEFEVTVALERTKSMALIERMRDPLIRYDERQRRSRSCWRLRKHNSTISGNGFRRVD